MASEPATPAGQTSGAAAAEADPPENGGGMAGGSGDGGEEGDSPSATDESEKLRLTAEKLKLQV